MKIFGIDPGSERTGYGCLETDGTRHHVVTCGALKTSPRVTFPEKLLAIHTGLAGLLGACHPDCVVIESLFYARNARSALILGHARGVALLAASELSIPVIEYAPAEVKRAVVGYGRAEKHQVQHMVQLLLGLDALPEPDDMADALALAICHAHQIATQAVAGTPNAGAPRSWRHYRPPAESNRL